MSEDNTIKLLDGSIWSKEELIHNMDNDEFYYKLCGKNMLSSSNAKLLLDSYKKYYFITKYGQSETQALRDGWLFHTAILEPNVFESQVFVDVQSKASKAYKLAVEENGKAFTFKERKSAERLADAFLKNSKLVSYLNKAKFEVPIAGEVMGMPFRGKADVIKGNTLIDLKTSADLNTFRYSADKYGYDLQAWLYLKLFNKDKFTFLVIDKASTDIGIFDVSEEFLARGENKFRQAVDNYKYFFQEENDLDQYVMRGIL